MSRQHERTALLLGQKAIDKLKNVHVLVVGLGGVGSYATEQLVRAGIGELTIVDGDTVQESNINRQLPATHQTIGQKKSRVLEQRYLDINPTLKLHVIDEYIFDHAMNDLVCQSKFDYVLDAIDTLSPKVNLIMSCVQNQIPIVSSMGAGARIDPSLVKISDVSKSFNDPLAFKVRKALHREGIFKGFKVVFSSELPNKQAIQLVENEQNKKTTAGTVSYMPAIFGLYCASVIIREITGTN